MLASTAPACRGEKNRNLLVVVSSLASIALGGAGLACAASPLPLGAAAPALALPSLDHGLQDLAAFTGRPVLVHFFATWCAPCRDEMAGLARLAERGTGGVAILAVDVGEVRVRVRRFFDAHPVPFPVLLDEDRAALKAWKVTGLPSSFVLDASHALRLYADGPVDWDDPAADRRLSALTSDTPAAASADLATAPEGAGLPPLNEPEPTRESSP